VIWQDNKAVALLTSDPAMNTDMIMAQRKSRKFVGAKRKSLPVTQPTTVATYIEHMAGVDIWCVVVAIYGVAIKRVDIVEMWQGNTTSLPSVFSICSNLATTFCWVCNVFILTNMAPV